MKYVIAPVRGWYSFRYGVESPQSLAAIVDKPSEVRVLKNEMGFRGPIFVSVFPEFMSGRKPSSVRIWFYNKALR